MIKPTIDHIAAVSILALALGSAQAGMIDDFTNDQLVRDPPNTGETSTSTLTGGDFIGTSRTITVDVNGSDGSVYAASNSVNPSILVMGNSGNATGIVTVQWDGIADSDFTEGGSATGVFLSFTDPIDHPLTVAFTAIDGIVASVSSKTFASGSQGPDFFVPFSLFDDPSALKSVNSFKATFTSTTANWDAGVGYLETRDAPLPVPGVLALMAIGLTGLRVVRRRAG